MELSFISSDCYGHRAKAPALSYSSSPWWESTSRSLLNGCFPWSRPSSLRHIFFLPSSSQCSSPKLGKTWWEPDMHYCTGSVQCSSHSEAEQCFLQGYFEQNICRKLTINNAAFSLKDQKYCKTSLCWAHLLYLCWAFQYLLLCRNLCTHRLSQA